jgi:peroxiredoxin
VTDDAGRFEFEPMIDAFSLIVVDDAGYLDKRVEGITPNAELRLQRWARVEGQLLIGATPGTNESIRLWPAHIPYEHHPRDFAAVQFYMNTKSDAEGKFVFERVPPTHVEIYHEPKVRDSRGTIPMAQTTKFTLRPDETRHVTLGGKGRPVVGKIVVEGYEGKINWRADVHMLETVVPDPEGVPNFRTMSQEFGANMRGADTDEEKAALQAEFNEARKAAIEKHKEFYATREGRAHHFRNKRYALNFSQDGSFRIEDVPGGRYKLKLDLREGDGDGPSRFSKPQIANLVKEIEVPDSPGGRTDEPYDLGEIAVQARAAMKAGKGAPNFEVKTVDGKSIKLSDFKGKYVLLDFWAVWCGPCVAETPNLKEAYAAFKDDPRFAMIGLSLDPKESAPRDYAKKNDLGWVQGFLGEWSKTDLPKQYGVEGIPAIFLIGPDGKIVSTGLRGPAIKSSIQAALKKE